MMKMEAVKSRGKVRKSEETKLVWNLFLGVLNEHSINMSVKDYIRSRCDVPVNLYKNRY